MVLDAITLGLKLIDKWLPSEAERDKAKLALLQMQQEGELRALAADVEIAKGQLSINAAEAPGGLFVAGWRPFIGWVCGAAFALNFVGLPLFRAAAASAGYPVVFPGLDMAEMMPVLLGMLGLGGFRTYEKTRVAK